MINSNTNLRTAIIASVKAGQCIMDVYKKDTEVEYKADNSPLTIADKNSHLKIIEYLNQTGIPVLSEEGKSVPYEVRKLWKEYWLIDPLDGTKEFVKRNGEFTVNIAYIENNKPVMGIIYVPVTDVLYFGSYDKGSYITLDASAIIANYLIDDSFIFNLIKKSSRLPVYEKKAVYTVVASRSHLSSETESFVTELRKKHGEVVLINSGSSLKLCLVAEGQADIYPRLAPTMEWDIAAGHAIAAFAGCTVTSHENNSEIEYNKENLLNPHFIVSRN